MSEATPTTPNSPQDFDESNTALLPQDEVADHEATNEAAEYSDRERFLQELSRGEYYIVQRAADGRTFSDSFLHSPEVQEAAQKGFINLFAQGYIDSALTVRNTFSLSEQFIQEVVQKDFTELIARGELYSALKRRDAVPLPDSFLHSPEVQEAAQKGFIDLVARGNLPSVLTFRDTLSLPDSFLQSPEVQEAAKTRFADLIARGDLYSALELRDAVPFPDSFLHSPEVQEAAKTRFADLIARGNLPSALELRDAVPFPDSFLHSSEVQETAQKVFIDLIACGNLPSALELRDAVPFPDSFLHSPEVQEAAKTRFADLIARGNLPSALELRDTLSLPDSFLQSPEVQEAVQKRLRSSDSFEEIAIISENFSVPEEEFRRIVLGMIEQLGIALTIEEVIDIAKNDRFGKNLLEKFGEFDWVAKRAVNKVLSIDASTDSALDRRSLAYRQVAQTRLRDFAINADILHALESQRIDTEKWLNYEKIAHFSLGEADDLSLAEQIIQPVERLAESVTGFVRVMRGVITEYKGELVNATIDEDVSMISEQISGLEERLSREENPAKREGMENALRSLRARKEEPKKLRVWDKLTTEASKLEKLGNETVELNKTLIALEKERVDISDENTLAQEEKRKETLFVLKKRVTEQIDKLRVRITEIQKTYRKILSSVIGDARADGVMQQIDGEVGEYHDHLQTDFAALALFLGEKKEGNEPQVDGMEVINDDKYTYDPKMVKTLEGRAMSIRVGGRSRQDLYLGNYTTCCIRIDSEYHGAESPIADYVTDLGMQNVIIYDEARKQPIACAWCWVGMDLSDGKRALVVDNVEGWQAYTVNFRTQLETELHAYLESYAKAIGVDFLAQGPDYNDLNVIPLNEQSDYFEKFGGYNRADGYYLEAEHEGSDEVADGGEQDEGTDDEEWEDDQWEAYYATR